jgi:hypothetical protein
MQLFEAGSALTGARWPGQDHLRVLGMRAVEQSPSRADRLIPVQGGGHTPMMTVLTVASVPAAPRMGDVFTNHHGGGADYGAHEHDNDEGSERKVNHGAHDPCV